MSRSFPADVAVQKFLEQSYDKERDARLHWWSRSVSDVEKKSKQLEVFKKKIEAAAPRPGGRLLALRDVKPKSYHRRIFKPDDHLVNLARSTQSAPAADMRPVPDNTRDSLYEGITKEGRGRYQYLSSRYRHIPECKYQFPVLNSWEYGWRLGDVIRKDEIKKPDFGRTRIVADTFYTRTGIPGSSTTIC